MNPIIPFIALPLAYGLADRFAGGGWPWLDDKLPGRAAFWGAVVAAGVGFAVTGIPGSGFGLVWLIYRTPGWKVFGGSATPRTASEIAGTVLRHLIALPLALVLAYFAHLSQLLTGAAFGAYAGLATLLAIWYAHAIDHPDATPQTAKADNAGLEFIRGAAFGLAVAVVLS